MRFNILVTATLFVLFANNFAFACSCTNTSGYVADYAKRFDVIFLGTPIETKLLPTSDGYISGRLQTKFEIEKTFKGTSNSIERIVTGASTPSCGFSFVLAKEYVVFARKNEKEELVTGLCAMTNFSKSDVLEYFEQGIDKNHMNRESCFQMIKGAYDAEALMGEFKIDDKRCLYRKEEYDRLYMPRERR